MYAVIHFPSPDDGKEGGASRIDREELRRIANTFSPLFEIVDSRTIAIDIRGLDLLFPGGNDEILSALEAECASAGRRAQIVIAASLAQGVLAALALPGATVLAAGEGPFAASPENAASDRLRSLPLEKAGLPPSYLEIFDEWGVRTVGQLLALPEGELISRLGGELEPLLRGLAGCRARPLLAEQPRREFVRRVDPEDALEDLASCLALIEERLASILVELGRYGLAAGTVIVTAEDRGETREIRLRLPLPSVNLRFLMKLLALEFEKVPDGIVRGLEIAVLPEAPRRVQPSFWQPPFPDGERLELTLAKLRSLLGPENVGRPLMLDSYHARHFRVEPGTSPSGAEPSGDESAPSPLVVFRHFHEPRPVLLEKVDDAFLFSAVGDARRRLVTRYSGPWLSSGGWWASGGGGFGENWSRREVDVELGGGGGRIYRVVEDADGHSYAEGYYD